MTKRRSATDTPAGPDEAAVARRTRSSVHEAIGKLIGDDAATRRGTAGKEAAGDDDDEEPTRS
ncbi:hypothetical protein [Sphingomonas phyllosphaerae]|uniref:hypothetical protein n=1 Tax=Sphingomonas phyllosphaerae TaxID=257003 RepID=UPI0003B4CFAC|nr:hypothetical protein [Sphingomonas phyllosphaerae]